MKIFIILGTLLFSISSWSQQEDKSFRMDKLLQESGVTGKGRRDLREANISCKVPTRTGVLQCRVMRASAEPTFSVLKKFQGQSAVAVSNLLKEFGIEPDGIRHRQSLDIICKNIRNTTFPDCEILESYPMLWI